MTNEGEIEMSRSESGQDPETGHADPSENVQDAAMESESEDEGIRRTVKRAKRMIIDDDDDDDDSDADDSKGEEAEESSTPKPKISVTKKQNYSVEEVLEKVLRDPDEEENEGKTHTTVNSNDEESEQESDEEANTQRPLKLDGDLYDAEESSDDENDLERAAGPEYDSAEDKDFDESTIDPKLLKKLKKLKGASKKPREQKSRKCKPTKEDMLALHSESQRLFRESHVSLPYHKPAPKTLQDFLARAQKKQEAYKNLQKGMRNDTEKARIIQEKIAEASIVKLPSLHQNGRSSHRNRKSVITSQQSLSDSGVASGTSSDMQSQEDISQLGANPVDLSPSHDAEVGEDELPDLINNHSDGLCDSQQTVKDPEAASQVESISCSQSSVERLDLQGMSNNDDIVEEFDTPPLKEDSQSQPIEDAESLSLKDDESQRSEDVIEPFPSSLEPDNICDVELATNNTPVPESVPDNCEFPARKAENKVSDETSLCEENSGTERVIRKRVDSSPPVKTAMEEDGRDIEKKHGTESSDDAECDSKETKINSIKTAKQIAMKELAQKGVVPEFKRGNGDFIILDVESKPQKQKYPDAEIDALVERLIRHQKKVPERPQDVEISIVEKTGAEGQEKELKLSTVTYRTKGDLDLSTVVQTSGNRLQALKAKLEEGMRRKRMEAYERRQQLYKMENEEGFEDTTADGLPDEEEEAEMTDKSDTDNDDNEDEDESDLDFEEDDKKKDWNNPFLDDEADEDDDDDYGYDHAPQQRACAEIDDMREDDIDLFKDSDQLHLKLDQSDEEEEEDAEEKDDEENDNLGTFKKPFNRSQRLIIDDEDDDDGSQLQSAQDPTKSCDPAIAGKLNYEKDILNTSLEVLTPMSRLLQDTPPSVYSSTQRSVLTQPVEDSQDLYGSQFDRLSSHLSSGDDTLSQILDADGYFRIPSTQRKKSSKPSLMMESSQDARDKNMDVLMGLCSGKFAEGSQGEFQATGGFGGLFDKSQQQDDRGSTSSLFDNSQHSETLFSRDSNSECDHTSQSETAKKSCSQSEEEDTEQLHTASINRENHSQQQTFSQSQASFDLESQTSVDGDMDDVIGLCSGQFPSTNPVSQKKSQPQERKGVKRRLIINDDSSDEEPADKEERDQFLIYTDNESTNDSNKNELSGSDDESHDAHNSDSEVRASFKGFSKRGKVLQQFVEDEAELSGSEVDSDENVDLDEEEDYLEMEAGDNDAINEDQLRDQVGRVHMKQMLDDDDRQLMRYKEMYLPDGDLHSEGGGRQRRFHWKNFGDESSQVDLFPNDLDTEKEVMEDPDEKQWRMERHEREKFLETQQEEGPGDEKDDNSQFLKLGQCFMKRQVSEPSGVPLEPVMPKPKLARSQSLISKSSPAKFLKPKVPKRGSLLSRNKEHLAKIAEITKASGLNVNGTRGSRNFVFSVKSSDKEETGENEQLLAKAAAPKPAAPSAAKKVTTRKSPAKRKCTTEPSPKRRKRNSIFKLLDK